MKFCAIACEVFARECSRAAANSPHVITLRLMPFGLHDRPDDLRASLQEAIDETSGKFDYLLLGYGLCSRGTADLTARETPVVIPRAHDCIAVLLGSHERYQREFGDHPGTYYYSPGWIERKEGEARQGTVEITKARQKDERFAEYVAKFGEDNARYLIEQESLWETHYDRAAFLNMGLGPVEQYREFTRYVANTNGWSYQEIMGDTRLIDSLLNGDWDPAEFLIVRPGQRTREAVNAGIIAAE